MQVLPPILTSASASGSPSPADSDRTDDGFLLILAEALTAMCDHLDGDRVEVGSDEPEHTSQLDVAATVGTDSPAPVEALELDDVETATTPAAVSDPVSHEVGAEPTPVDEPSSARLEGGDQRPVHLPPHASGPDDVRVDPLDVPGELEDVTSEGHVTPAGRGAAPVDVPLGEFRIPAWVLAQHQEQVALAQAGASTELDPAPAASTSPSASPPSPALPPTADAAASVLTGPPSVAVAMAAADQISFEALEAESPWEQLATVVRPLRQLPDGTHRLSLQLRPAELGTVHLEVALEDGRLSLRAVAEHLAARDVLAASLPELRAELSRAGIDLGSLDVGEQTFGRQGDAGQGSGEPHGLPGPPGRARTDHRSEPSEPPTSGAVAAGLPGRRLDLTL